MEARIPADPAADLGAEGGVGCENAGFHISFPCLIIDAAEIFGMIVER